ncbi:hypothetical protein M422DRAFT_266871 [Sphaerobolus stellatus SS14]|uniref:Unplaced genomic scaffold SPHSTscaffold_167, whole genome shotgun sequence n=1 Tax=Sphaerobolus stellatus (strain SS14) TaxID=990650 RepID=A0A0C9UAD0_SPHS4|nr:hypothetical protein M422DRAFT_266871 [Sphaerobolus stellatus SS14]
MSPSPSSSSNAADLLLRFRDQQAKHNGPRIEILDHINDAWSHVGTFITKLGDERDSLEDELFQEKSDNRQLQVEIDDLQEKIQTLETQLAGLHIHNTSSERSLTLTSPVDAVSSNVKPHPLASPGKWTYSQKHTCKLDGSSSFRNKVLKPDELAPYVEYTEGDNYEGYFLEEDIDVAAWLSKIATDLVTS